MSIKIPFKVSARTARLIGRENVATAKGAIIELVKNGYDADSQVCIVFIDNFYAIYHHYLKERDYLALLQNGISTDSLEEIYDFDANDRIYREKNDVSAETLEKFKLSIRQLSIIYIIDNGDGMTDQIIRDYWMIIGTDNKASNAITHDGRVKVGAKGIGRFALDKLGDVCEMITFYDPKVYNAQFAENKKEKFTGFRWTVNWNDFESSAKTIENVTATLEGITGKTFSNFVHEIGSCPYFLNVVDNINLSHGTILKISSPREAWDDENISRIFDDLGVLLPPSESNEFSIYLYSSNSPQKYGKVEASICDDYDYKLEAHADENQTVKICIYRNENDVETIPATFFERENQQKEPFTIDDFRRGYWETTRNFRQLCPGFDNVDIDHVFNNVGKFSFLFYYLKRTTTSNDEKRFFYRPCAYNLRKSWLDKYGGIKLFRDEFRVRPYGERKDPAFDWLGIGSRKAKSPAGVAKKNGGYKVEPENIAGLIKISRLTNVDFDDKSSREGLQENKTFVVFQELIKGIISIFEEDRSTIARELDAYDRIRNDESRKREDAAKLVQDILKSQQEQQSRNGVDYQSSDPRMVLLAESNRLKDEELEQMREEQKMLRVLASSGLMLASFSHDLSKLNITLESRYKKIESIFEEKVPQAVFDNVVDRKNPYYLLRDAKNTDTKIQSWLNFAIGVIKKDKRKRKDLPLNNYFDQLKETWSTIFESRAIKLSFENDYNIVMRVFEIDLDSIFHNLFSNSIEAFNLLKVDRLRTIDVKAYYTDKTTILEYRDSGCGLSADIVNPEDIFKPFFTTRRNQATGEEIGTGLGMWIVKSVADENDAKIKLLTPEHGFGIRFIFPIKYPR